MRNQFIGSIRTIWQAVLVIGLVLGWYCPASAQPDILPSSVDVRLVQGNGSDELLVQIKANSTAPFGGIFSALTVTIRYDASSGASLGAGSSFCNAWSAFTPSPVVVNNGTAYRTYNGFGLNRMEDPPFDGGCGLSIPAGTWFTITTIPVTGSCTGFILGNDAYTQVENRDYYISMGGYNVTGQVLSGSVNGGNCDLDCLGEPGGAALPGTACDDNDPGTSNDTWGADCVCAGTPVCEPPVIDQTTSNSPICSNATLNLGVSATGTAPLTYAWTGMGTFSPDAASPSVSISGAATGNYEIEVSNACGSVSAIVPVTVTSAPSATIAYPGSPYCSNGGTATVTRTGTAGGAYSASPAGLSINASTGAVNLGSSTPGSYTVTYTIAASGGCASFSTTANVTVTSAPSAAITYPGSPYCSNGGTATVTRTGTAGGAYSASPAGLSINASTGAINLATSSGGSYVVSYTIMASGGCPEVVVTAPVELQEAPFASIEYDGSPYCISGSGSASVTLTGTGGGVFTSAPTGLSLDSSTGLVDLDASIGGTYTVTYTLDAVGVCPGFVATTQIVLGTAPAATISYSGSPYCSVQTQATVTRNGSAGGTYSAVPAGLSINPTTGAINPSISSPGSYTVTYTIAAAGGCSAFTTTALVEVETATVWYADNDNDGAGDPLASIQACDQPPGYVVVAGDGCPTDPGKTEPGVCGCGSPDLDSDMDGVLDCLDNCPNQPGQIGDACDDGNANTADDVVTADCVCVGTVIWDCPSLEANIGDACDDGNANTADDVVTADCVCVGTVIWDCPSLEANIGDACDDGNEATLDDFITEECVCEGVIPDAIGGVAGNTSLTMSIFPNPSRSGPVLVHIEGLPQDRTSVLVLVLDASGRKVHQDSVHVVKGTVDHRLDLTRASRGVYVVEVLFSEGRLLGRLILQ